MKNISDKIKNQNTHFIFNTHVLFNT